jgi:hypothetical protein
MPTKPEENNLWTDIRNRLNHKYFYDDAWEEAIQLFHSRMQRKFLAPLELIIKRRSLTGEGFAIVTVQCALIETFAAFRKGLIFNHNPYNQSKFEYPGSQKIFTSFLKSASIFKDHFWVKNSKGKVVPNQPYGAADFYSNVRCGLMHEARTKSNWIIKAPNLASEKTEKKFIQNESGKIIILRNVLHYRLLEYLNIYEGELRQVNGEGPVLRKNFARKLDHLFDFAPDTAFDWWR